MASRWPTAFGKGPLPVDQPIEIGAGIARALSIAHLAGIVHRDVKPGNVMLTKSGVNLLDFGLAKPKPPAPSPRRLVERTTLSRFRAPPIAFDAPVAECYQRVSLDRRETK